jgi:V8-like Glu-specific endopeptidase
MASPSSPDKSKEDFMKSRPRLWFAGAATTFVVLAGIGTPAVAADTDSPAPVHIAISDPVPGGFASWDELFAMQARMDDALAAIEAVVDVHGYSGRGSAIAAPENRKLLIYWRGNLPTPVQQVISERRKTMPIQVLPARFTREQMSRTQERLMHLPGVMETEPRSDASGVTIHVRAGEPADVELTQQLAAAEADVTVIPDGVAGVTNSRSNDSPPYYAGARMRTTLGGYCTTGFAVSISGGTYMFTAGHCLHYNATNPEKVYDGGDDLIGTTFRDNDARDIGLFTANAAGRTWDGPATEASFSKAVQSASASANGNWLCTSGASSGIRCGIQVITINTSYTDTNGVSHSPIVRAEQTNHDIATANGDSGGPVFSLPSPDNGKVIAKGIISGGDPYNANPGVYCPQGNCSWRLFYADMKQSMAWYGMTLITG